jgi:hypothetical protein
MRTVALFALLAAGLMAADSKSTTLTIRVAPEALVTMEGTETVSVKIRLSAKSQAQLWIADSCSAPPGASQTIAQSGSYTIPVATLSGTGSLVCLSDASDGILTSVPLNEGQ